MRRASVNSFGYGGTNAHVVLDDVGSYLRLKDVMGNHCTKPTMSEEIRVDSPFEASLPTSLPRLLVFSASDKEDISRQVNIHSEYLWSHAGDGPSFLDNYAYTLANGRTSHAWKSFSILESTWDAKDLDLASNISVPTQGLASATNLAFVFTGQGAQWFGMGRELLVCAVFRDSISASQNYLEELGWRLSLESMYCKACFLWLHNDD